MEIKELIGTIPTTRYQGSKRKILLWIYECMRGYEFHTVLDAFGGSGMVSCLLKRMGKRVTYNDLFRFNQMIGQSVACRRFLIERCPDLVIGIGKYSW